MDDELTITPRIGTDVGDLTDGDVPGCFHMITGKYPNNSPTGFGLGFDPFLHGRWSMAVSCRDAGGSLRRTETVPLTDFGNQRRPDRLGVVKATIRVSVGATLTPAKTGLSVISAW